MNPDLNPRTFDNEGPQHDKILELNDKEYKLEHNTQSIIAGGLANLSLLDDKNQEAAESKEEYERKSSELIERFGEKMKELLTEYDKERNTLFNKYFGEIYQPKDETEYKESQQAYREEQELSPQQQVQNLTPQNIAPETQETEASTDELEKLFFEYRTALQNNPNTPLPPQLKAKTEYGFPNPNIIDISESLPDEMHVEITTNERTMKDQLLFKFPAGRFPQGIQTKYGQTEPSLRLDLDAFIDSYREASFVVMEAEGQMIRYTEPGLQKPKYILLNDYQVLEIERMINNQENY